jgi:murein L,D-transpeptidase YafK
MAGRPLDEKLFARGALLAAAALALAGCQASDIPKQVKPVPYELVASMNKLDMKETSQIFVRIFKEESELEIWKQKRNGDFALLKTYDICKWSGELGPKRLEGDRQAPEGFYTVTPGQMNPKSSYYLSFNMGYPNAFDRSLGRTGSNLMVHGACSSAGCYSMTDEDAGEIFALARDSFRGGQVAFQIQAFPFRMTPQNLARHHDDPNMDFWRMLKVGYDSFELTRRPPRVDVCDKRYVFNAESGDVRFEASGACPSYEVAPALVAALESKQAQDDRQFAIAVAALEQEAQKAATAQQAAAARKAEAERRAAERDAAPSLIDRMMARVRGTTPEANGAAASPVPAGPVAAVGAPATPVVASVPVPRVRSDQPAPAVTTASVPPVKKPAAAVPPPVQAPAAQSAAAPGEEKSLTPGIEEPPVGRFVKRKFLWTEDDEAEAAPGEVPG